ncbi:MAG: squalene synthase HpnC [Ignavibacteriales bacterium]|nr:squalene synthase HpnC [Ignavibacteriales bacterium]
MKNTSNAESQDHNFAAMAGKHYENFPVGSFMLPRRLRRPVHLIYAYARVADDFADEGTESEETRLQRLNEWESALLDAVAGRFSDPFFAELAGVISRYGLSISYFRDLIAAFRMDTCAQKYETYEDLLGYCRHSANPIGRLLLELFGGADVKTQEASDALCTALQLANFWQDISVDTQRERLYIPMEDLARFGCSMENVRSGALMESVVEFEVERTIGLFDSARPLVRLAPKGLGFETALTWHGGMRILERIRILKYGTATRRPALTPADKVLLFWRAFQEIFSAQTTS